MFDGAPDALDAFDTLEGLEVAPGDQRQHHPLRDRKSFENSKRGCWNRREIGVADDRGESSVDVERDEKGKFAGATLRSDGQPVLFGGVEKMSKSKNNGIDPQSMVDRYGADTVRSYMMFFARWEQGGPWNSRGIEGTWRWLKKVWALMLEPMEEP